MSIFAEDEEEKGSLTRKVNIFKRQHADSEVTSCFRMWRHRFEKRMKQKQIVQCLASYSTERLLGSVLKAWSKFCKQKHQRVLRLDEKATIIRRREAQRIKLTTFAVMARIARRQ